MEDMQAFLPDCDKIDDLSAAMHMMREERFMPTEDGFPAESFEEFSESPLEFEEMATALRDDLESVYTLTGTLNRFSPDYVNCCRVLEKMIRRMGSYCVTRAVLEQKGFAFPKLKTPDLQDLYSMLSFNFRKTRKAFHDGKAKRNCADMKLLDLECRWVDLAEKLKATGERIRLIQNGKISADAILEREQMFKGGKVSGREASSSRPLDGKARALPVIGSVARQMIAERKEAEKKEAENARLTGMGGSMNFPAFRNVRPFTTPIFRPSKEIMALAQQDELMGMTGLRLPVPELPVMESPAAEDPLSPQEPEEAEKPEKDGPIVKKSRKQRRREAALARAARKEFEEMVRQEGEKTPVRV